MIFFVSVIVYICVHNNIMYKLFYHIVTIISSSQLLLLCELEIDRLVKLDCVNLSQFCRGLVQPLYQRSAANFSLTIRYGTVLCPLL